MRIAIIGSGISGLVAAYKLHQEHAVQVFEADSRIGGHTHTVAVEVEGEKQRIDTGFIVFNTRNYPLFSQLLEDIGVASQPTDMSFAVRCDHLDLEYNGSEYPHKLFAQKRNLFRPLFWRLIQDIRRFNRSAQAVLTESDDLSVQEFVRRESYAQVFTDLYLAPLGSSLWSCSAQQFNEFPIRFVVEFLQNHAMLQILGRPVWRVIKGGSSSYLGPLTAGFRESIRTSCPVTGVRRTASNVYVEHSGGQSEEFDEVIFACHADQALRILSDATPLEKEVLSAFPYQKNRVLLHTDATVLPRRRLARASWNYDIRGAGSTPTTVTYNMTLLQSLRSKHEFCVTLNDDGRISEDKVLREFEYAHPTFDSRRRDCQARHAELIRKERTSFCGAYWGYGFHEDGVRSATAVAEAFTADSP